MKRHLKGGYLFLPSLESFEPEEVVMNTSFNERVKASNTWPGGKDMGSGTVWIHRNGMAEGEWRVVIGTKNGRRVIRWGLGKSEMVGTKREGILLISHSTESEALSWTNSVICAGEIATDKREMRKTVHEWK